MSSLAVIATILYTLIIGEFVVNIFQVIRQAKKLKESGKTPLTKNNLFTVTAVSIVEGLIVGLCTYLVGLLHFNQASIDYVVVVFLIIYLIKFTVAYVTAWGVWTVFVTIEGNQMKKKIDEGRERAFK